MSNKKPDYKKQRTLFKVKKGANSNMLKPNKGVQILVDGQEVEFVETEYQGKKGRVLYINKIDDEISRIEELKAEGKMKAEVADPILDSLQKDKEYGNVGIVKAFLK